MSSQITPTELVLRLRAVEEKILKQKAEMTDLLVQLGFNLLVAEQIANTSMMSSLKTWRDCLREMAVSK